MPIKLLGQGSYGSVELEECIQGKSLGTLRAVKKLWDAGCKS